MEETEEDEKVRLTREQVPRLLQCTIYLILEVSFFTRICHQVN
jgi:hypothetical protein